MKKRGAVMAVVVILAGVVVISSAATGRLSLLANTWGPVASSVASAARLTLDLKPQTSSSAGTADAIAPSADAAAATVHRQTGPLSSAQLGAPLVHGTFIRACGAPDDMKVVVNASVKMGRAVHVTATTQPSDPVVAQCVEHAIRDLSWDSSPKTGHVAATY